MTKTEFVGVRVTPEISDCLDRVAASHRISRSILIRGLLENCDHLYSILKANKEDRQKDREAREKELLTAIKERLPEDLTPAMAEMMGEMMNTVMRQVAEQLIAERDYKT